MTKDTGVTPEHTIAQAKEILLKIVNEGFICPCCNQPAKMYVRQLTSAMAMGLITMYKAADEHKDTEGYIHVENYFKSIHALPASIRGDLPKLRFWNLIEPDFRGREEEGVNPNNGKYRLTPAGKKFVELHIVVPSHVKLYNNRFFGHPHGSKMINISEALKKKFDYLKLMKGEL